MKRIIFCSFIIVSGMILMSSCKHELPSLVEEDQQATQICFESEVLPLFQSYCAKAGCHDNITAEEGYKLTSYNNIVARGIRAGNANDSKLYKVLYETGEDKMPPNGNPDLTEAQKTIIRKWINQGANNTVNCGVTCDATAFQYNANIKPLLTTCNACHVGAAPSGGGIDLSTYTSLKNYITDNPGRLLNSLKHTAGYSPMPQGGAKLSDCNIAQIENWINAGAPNN
jgi:cytochrome c553